MARKLKETQEEHTRTGVELDSRELAELEGFVEMRLKWLDSTPIYNSNNFGSREQHREVLNSMHARISRARAQLTLDTDGHEAVQVEFARKGSAKHRPDIQHNHE